MASTFKDILSPEDLLYLTEHPEVLAARSNSAPFYIDLTDSIRSTLSGLGMDLSSVKKIPLKWIHEDTAPHADSGSTPFTKTFLVYLSASKGEFILGENTYPITENTAFVFDEGTLHKTVGTEPRLLIGPMSERADPVGIVAYISYYRNEADALSTMNSIGNTESYTVGTVGGFSKWRIAPNSTGTSSQAAVYNAGSILNTGGYYYLYPVLGPAFVFESPQVQTAANTVYQYKTAFDAAAVAAGSQQVHNFKTDRERMQYKLGQYGLYSRGLAPG